MLLILRTEGRQKLIYKKSCENICKTLISFNFKQHFQHNFPRTLKEPILVITKTINDAFMIPLFQRLMVYVKVLNIHICFNKIKISLQKRKPVVFQLQTSIWYSYLRSMKSCVAHGANKMGWSQSPSWIGLIQFPLENYGPNSFWFIKKNVASVQRYAMSCCCLWKMIILFCRIIWSIF